MDLIPLDDADSCALADALGDSPWTVITVHLLRRGLCAAYIEGNVSSPTVAVIQWRAKPEEVTAFGSDVPGMWRLLRHVRGWRSVNVDEEHARDLGAIIEREQGRVVRYYGDMHYILSEASVTRAHPLVRRLTLDDVDRMEKAPALLQQGRAFGGATGLLREGVVAGAVDAGVLVATAHTSSVTDGYADIGVATLEPYRSRGISTAAASLVCTEVLTSGRTPVWSCGEDNWASLRVAQKIGFIPIGRRVYVIPGSEQGPDSRHVNELSVP